jgi:hypothetical protein
MKRFSKLKKRPNADEVGSVQRAQGKHGNVTGSRKRTFPGTCEVMAI